MEFSLVFSMIIQDGSLFPAGTHLPPSMAQNMKIFLTHKIMQYNTASQVHSE
jgi:hypothetical protein